MRFIFWRKFVNSSLWFAEMNIFLASTMRSRALKGCKPPSESAGVTELSSSNFRRMLTRSFSVVGIGALLFCKSHIASSVLWISFVRFAGSSSGPFFSFDLSCCARYFSRKKSTLLHFWARVDGRNSLRKRIDSAMIPRGTSLEKTRWNLSTSKGVCSPSESTHGFVVLLSFSASANAWNGSGGRASVSARLAVRSLWDCKKSESACLERSSISSAASDFEFFSTVPVISAYTGKNSRNFSKKSFFCATPSIRASAIRASVKRRRRSTVSVNLTRGESPLASSLPTTSFELQAKMSRASVAANGPYCELRRNASCWTYCAVSIVKCLFLSC